MLITVIHIFDKLLETLYNLLNIELLNCSVIIKRVYSSLSYYNKPVDVAEIRSNDCMCINVG